MMDYKAFLKRQVLTLSLAIIFTIVIGGSITYAVFIQKNTNTQNQVVMSGDLEITYETGNVIAGEFLPKSTNAALLDTGYTFTVRNTGSLPASYVIKIYNNTTGSNFLAHNQLYISLNNDTPQLISTLEKEDPSVIVENDIVYLIFKTGTVDVEDSKSHNVKVWLREDAESNVVGKNVSLILEVESIVND